MNDGSLWEVREIFFFEVGGIDREFYMVFFLFLFPFLLICLESNVARVRHGRDVSCRDICYHTGEGGYNNITLKELILHWRWLVQYHAERDTTTSGGGYHHTLIRASYHADISSSILISRETFFGWAFFFCTTLVTSSVL